MKLWQHMYTTLKQKPRGVISKATLLPSASLLSVSGITANIYEKDPQPLLEVIKLLEKLNVAQQVTATLTSPTVNMMLNDDRCFVCVKSGHIGHHCHNALCHN